MKRCPNCNYENAQINMHCERCGTPLAQANSLSEQTYMSTNEAYTMPGERSVTTQEQSYYTPVPPPPPVYQESRNMPLSPPSTYYAPMQSYSYADPVPVVSRRSFGAALLSSILYLLGAFCFAFGVAGFMLYGTSTTLVGIVFIVLSIIALVVLVALLIMRKRLVLKWWVRVLITVGMTIAAAVVLFMIAIVNQAGSNYAAFGIVFIIYGFVAACVSFW